MDDRPGDERGGRSGCVGALDMARCIRWVPAGVGEVAYHVLDTMGRNR